MVVSRKVAVVALLGLTLSVMGCSQGAVENKANNYPDFVFKNLRQDAPLSELRDDFRDCNKLKATGTHVCHYDDPVLAGYSPKVHSIWFDDVGFYSLFSTYESDYYHLIASNLTQAYGAPCKVDTEKLHNAFNAEFENVRTEWCFNGGVLVFERFYDNLRTSKLEYNSTRDTVGETIVEEKKRPEDL